MRRGLPAAHVTLRAEHPSGDDHWFGISAAVLAGDLAFVWADQLLDGLDSIGLPIGSARRARAVFTTMRTEVIAGQFLDLQLGSVPTTTEDDVARIALLKSARYTVTRPLQIGATLAGADDDLCDRLARYGDAVGIAFQLRDDVLGLFGEPERTGKSCADDLREGKRNLLMQCALRRADASGRGVLVAALGASDVDQATVDRCREVVAKSGALSEVEALIGAHLDRALALSGTFDERATVALRQLARDAARRES
jgi:geranylgeranyl diphosphate synthase type I